MTQTPTSTPNETPTSTIIWPDDGKEMIFIASSTYEMGSNDGNPNHQPQHQMEVADFYLDRWPVTNAEYKKFVDATGHHVPNYEVSWCETKGYNWDPQTCMYPEGTADHPVVLITWDDAMAYAAWSRKRLPTEAEWERAARGPKGWRHPWGNEFISGRCNSREADLKGTSPVGYFSPDGDTLEGLIDMVGNVWEWTNSLFHSYPYNPNDGRESREAIGFRVLRGGSWVNDASVANCLSRLDGDFQFYNNVGFRCAVSPEE
jgi:formylglycine-generating enzyme required for sulfatase activity